MKMLNIFRNRMKPIMMFITVILLVLVGVFHYVFFHYETDLITNRSVEIEIAYKESQWSEIEALMNVSNKMARVMATETAKDIVRDIHIKYPNLKELSDEFDKGNYNSAKFTQLVMDNVKNRYMYDIQDNNNDVFVISKNGIIVDMNLNSTDSIHRSFEKEAEFHYNNVLMHNAFNALFNNKKDSFIYYESRAPINENEHKLIEIPTKAALKEVFMKEGLEGLYGYTFLVPAYVTEDGDVFGTPDISENGTKNHNHKFIVVQRYNVYDIMQKNDHRLIIGERAYKESRDGLIEILQFSAISYTAIALLDIIALLLLILYTTGNIKKSDN